VAGEQARTLEQEVWVPGSPRAEGTAELVLSRAAVGMLEKEGLPNHTGVRSPPRQLWFVPEFLCRV